MQPRQVEERPEKGLGFEGQRRIMLPEAVVTATLREHPILRGLLAIGAGYFPKAEGHLRRRPRGIDQAIVIYCAKGGGWCELGGRLHTVRAGDLLALPPGLPHAYGAHVSNPWTIHWVHAAGSLWRDYLAALGTTAEEPVVRVGDDLQIALLFNEVLKALEAGATPIHLLHASTTLTHLLALAALSHREHARQTPDNVDKVGQCIVYMSEHLDQPLRVAALAALANVSPAHFTALFNEQTGCSPRDYLHLLRIHQACQLLHDTQLPIKEIAARLGYQDPFHFSRQFRAFEGVSPTEYRGGV
jgi:AraC family transcriptional regulator, arabinose operon regulatory protein